MHVCLSVYPYKRAHNQSILQCIKWPYSGSSSYQDTFVSLSTSSLPNITIWVWKIILATKTVTTFFSSVTTHASSQLRVTQLGSRPKHWKMGTIGQATATSCTCRICPSGPLPCHPWHWQIKAISIWNWRSVLCFRELSMVDLSMLEISQRKKFRLIKFQNLKCLANKIVWLLRQIYWFSYIYFGLFSKMRQHFKM